MTTVFSAKNVGDLAGALPTLFGFMPEHSLVACATTGPNHRMGFRLRVDLPAERDVAELAELATTHLVNQGAEGVIIMVIGDLAEQHVARLAATALEESAASKFIKPVVSIWVDTENQTAVDLNDPDMQHYDLPEVSESVALAVSMGQCIQQDRVAVAKAYDHRPGELADAVIAQLEGDIETPDEDEAHTALARMLNAAPRNISLLSECIATLVMAGVDIEIRDSLWGAINRVNATEMATALRTAAVHAPVPLAHPLYALTAFADWQSGDGAKALIAAENALAIQPGYSMAELIIKVLDMGLNPDKWADFNA